LDHLAAVFRIHSAAAVSMKLAGKWQREQTAAEPLRGRTAASILFLSALEWACW
jgi:hypothetical protein